MQMCYKYRDKLIINVKTYAIQKPSTINCLRRDEVCEDEDVISDFVIHVSLWMFNIELTEQLLNKDGM